jgi:hypothetical protein
VKPQNECGHVTIIHNTYEETNFAKKDIVRSRTEARKSIIVTAVQITTDRRIINH